tara:strand:+ start:302 stop:589 length:288 start_codon:yes stop_codon:yes gene_type:complete
MSNEPERLSHEWHARECDLNAQSYGLEVRAIPSARDRGLATQEEQHRDRAAKLRQAEEDAALLRDIKTVVDGWGVHGESFTAIDRIDTLLLGEDQ